MAEVSIESCLPFVPLLYSYQRVYVTQVKLSKMVAPYKILKTDVSKVICFFKVIELRPQKSTRWLKDLSLCEPKPWEDQDQIMLAANASLMYLSMHLCSRKQGGTREQIYCTIIRSMWRQIWKSRFFLKPSANSWYTGSTHIMSRNIFREIYIQTNGRITTTPYTQAQEIY